MTERLREYIDKLFQDAPQTKQAVEMQEEILQNLLDKYNDLLAEGKTEEAACNIAIASVGDLSHLLKELQGMPRYTPEEQEIIKEYREKKAKFTSIAVAGYIISAIPLLTMHSPMGVMLTLLLVAGATSILVYLNMTQPPFMRQDTTMAEDFREWRHSNNANRQLYRSICQALWLLTVIAYFLISFTMGHWHLTWLIFLLAGALNAILKAVFDLKQ